MLSSFLQVCKQSNFTDWFLIATDFFCFLKVLLIFYRLLQCLLNEKIQHLVHFFYCYWSLLLQRQCCSPCFCRFVLLFMIREFYFYPPIMAAIKHYVIFSGMTGRVYMIFNFDGSPQNYLTILEAFWTSMLHCFWPVVQFSREICSREIVLAKCLWSLSLTYAMFMKFLQMIGCIHSIWVG